MNRSRVHSILSEVHRLLSEYAETDFMRASQYVSNAPHLRIALRELAREAGRFPSRGDSHEALGRRSSLARRPEQSEGPDQKRELVEMFRRTRRFNSTQSIIEFAKNAGLKVAARPKDSRARLAGRVADAIMLTPEPRRSQILSSLLGGSDTQTQGWIDVLRGSRP